MVPQRLAAGLSDQEHQRRILSEASTLVTLKQKVEQLCVLETTEESSSVLQGAPEPPSNAALVKSNYRKQKLQPPIGKNGGPKDPARCRWCGEQSHPKGKPLEKMHCTARDKDCYNCGKKGHIAAVCDKQTSPAAAAAAGSAGEPVLTTYSELSSEASVSFSFDSKDFLRA